MKTLLVDNKRATVEQCDMRISLALMSSYVVLTVQYFFLIILGITETPAGNNIQLVSKGIVGIIYLMAMPIVLKRSLIAFVSTYIVAIVLFAINILLFPENLVNLKELVFPLFFMCLPSFLYSLSIVHLSELKKVMQKTSMIVCFAGLSITILVFAGKVSVGDYSMSLSYYMLLPAVISLDGIFEKFNLKSFIEFFISSVVILSIGSRGAILCMAVFAILKIVFAMMLNLKAARVAIVALILGIAVWLSYYEILAGLSNVLEKFGIRSRSVILFLRGDVHLSGRDVIFAKVMHEVKNSPILGIGLSGDRRIVGKSYVHNIVLEIFANFGFVVGTFLLVLLIYSICKALLKKDSLSTAVVTIWMSLGFVHLFVSSSYLIDLKFWLFMGLVCRSYFPNKAFERKMHDPERKYSWVVRDIK